MAVITALLIANRGEIALRIARTARARGVRALGVYTAADADLPAARRMDEAVEIGDYLDVQAILRAAAALGAEAVHPGYGFLAENADFAQAVRDAGLVWVGPPPDAIRAMGSKAEARRTMAARGVPVVPGVDVAGMADADIVAAAEAIGFPVLVKASAGGGGKGMQVCGAAAELPAALAAARRLAAAAFGDDRLIVERYLQRPRHVEAQVIADQHGHVTHLFERECSIQRRHQKVIEEAPSPLFAGEAGAQMRAALLADAVEAARAVGYQNAGTVEFIVDEQGRHYFLEMNTRLQVEHPVTELVTGVDLVDLQLDVAEGRALDLDVSLRGHAVEARLYAEDPDAGWLPRSGTLRAFSVPARPGLRVDAGFEAGSTVGTQYDPMLAKIIAWGPDRATAVARLAGALASATVLGVETNQDHLVRVLRHPAFAAGALHTGFLGEHAEALGPGDATDSTRVALAVAACLAHPGPGPVPGVRPGFQTNPWPEPPLRLAIGDAEHAVTPTWTPDGVVLSGARWGETAPPPGVPAGLGSAAFPTPTRARLDGDRLTLGDRRVGVAFAASGDTTWVQVGARAVAVRRLPDLPAPGLADATGGLTAPMPGKVVRIEVAAGDPVEAGQPLVVLEAMKMEQVVSAPEAGVVVAVLVAEGDQVDGGQPLVRVAGGPDTPDAVS